MSSFYQRLQLLIDYAYPMSASPMLKTTFYATSDHTPVFDQALSDIDSSNLFIHNQKKDFHKIIDYLINGTDYVCTVKQIHIFDSTPEDEIHYVQMTNLTEQKYSKYGSHMYFRYKPEYLKKKWFDHFL